TAALQMQACLQPTNTGGVVVGTGVPGDPALPEPSSGYITGKVPVMARSYMAVTANPFATQAACETLRDGGTAVDAAVAAQMVLGLVEPQSSGLGGGAFMLHYKASTREVQSYDGRETAPVAATEDYLRYVSATDNGNPLPDLGSAFLSTKASGRSIGVPGAVRMLALAHQDNGAKPWASLMEPGIRLASDGFRISGRLAAAISGATTDLRRDPEAAAYFLNPDFTPKTLGTSLRNPAYADTLRLLTVGADAFYNGAIAQSIVDKARVTSGTTATGTVPMTPSLMTLKDLRDYQAIRRAPVCSSYRNTVVCGMGPPSSGGIAVAQTLGILESFDLSQANFRPTLVNAEGGKPSMDAVHVISEAQRLAYADRNRYVADTDYIPLPGQGVSTMIDKTYLKSRASLISMSSSLGTAPAGNLGSVPLGMSATEGKGTTHLSIVDKYGNAVAMTTTIESGMGSFHFTRGFLLNNQLTDFSFTPSDTNGPIANRIQPGKRPRSSMAPTIVFDRAADGSRGDLLMVTGSPGGASIIQFVVKTLVSAIDWGFDAQQASSMVNFGSSNGPTTGVGGEHPSIDASNNGSNDPLVTGLRARGHTVSVAAQSSGVSTIVRKNKAGVADKILEGGADPRREGIALGDPLQ
ncbi:MAG: gamma-glutamyltransferase family protein, partial [Ramlibacter sp.]|nr:gamma-glutamyltransferase family protein [Ramlibacter sp.]